MLISTRRRFVFVANLKTGSSAIEQALRGEADIAVTETRLGKHLPLTQIEKRFAWLFRHYPLDEMFVFGVMREPVDFLLSLYNSHTKAPAGDPMPSTRGQPFDAFVRDWSANSWQARPQRLMFERDGAIAVDALIDFRRLEPQFAAVCRRFDAKPALRTSNVSPRVMTREAIPPETLAEIREIYAEDYAFYERHAGRMKAEDGGWSPIPHAVAAPEPLAPGPAAGPRKAGGAFRTLQRLFSR
jgi:hypothetical protein